MNTKRPRPSVISRTSRPIAARVATLRLTTAPTIGAPVDTSVIAPLIVPVPSGSIVAADDELDDVTMPGGGPPEPAPEPTPPCANAGPADNRAQIAEAATLTGTRRWGRALMTDRTRRIVDRVAADVRSVRLTRSAAGGVDDQ